MIKTVVEAVFGSRQDREVKRLQPVLAAIREHEQRLAALDEAGLRGQTARFRGIIAERTEALRGEVDRLRAAKHGCADPVEREAIDQELQQAEHAWKQAIVTTLDELLPEAFATVREACRRLMGTTVQVTGQPLDWNMVPFDVQLIGGINLHRGRIAEMATGEGKTLVAVLPMYLNALPGRGAHLVTVNNYLARRDSQWMGHVFTWLGLTVACLDDTEPSSPERRAAYNADITYGTNNEFGFDYLRDNMVFGLDQRVQREHVYAIIDEVDSILIDEARTPLIISGPVGDEDSVHYRGYNPKIGDLVRKQNEIVSGLAAEGERLLENEKTRADAGVKLYQAQLGMPKNKKLVKLLNETGVKQLVQRAELDYIADRKLLDEAAADARPGGVTLLRAGREGPLGAPHRSRLGGALAARPDALHRARHLAGNPPARARRRPRPSRRRPSGARRSRPTTPPRASSCTSSTSCCRPTPCTNARSITSCRMVRCSSSTSSPDASCTGAAGRTACTRRWRPRRV